MSIYRCRHCGSSLNQPVVDLGHQPPSNSYLTQEQLLLPEITYPLRVFVCQSCWLVQLPAHAPAEALFTSDYAYFSSTSTSWCNHANRFVEESIEKLALNHKSLVLELASNDGYLLQYFKRRKIPCIGVEPTKAAAEVARAKGIQTIERFFGSNLAAELPRADLIVANNVLAHVPDINDFVAGIARVLKPNGRVSIECPHLLKLLQGNQFDTIYHEHYSYISLQVLVNIALEFGLDVVDVDELPTHGGSIRAWLAHRGEAEIQETVTGVLSVEAEYGLQTLAAYENLQKTASTAKHSLLTFLLQSHSQGRRVLGYGAAAKGNTLLNYAGIRSDLVQFVADRSPTKQGKYLPGSHIPVITPEELVNQNCDIILILPWNLRDEIVHQFPKHQLVTAIPSLQFV